MNVRVNKLHHQKKNYIYTEVMRNNRSECKFWLLSAFLLAALLYFLLFTQSSRSSSSTVIMRELQSARKEYFKDEPLTSTDLELESERTESFTRAVNSVEFLSSPKKPRTNIFFLKMHKCGSSTLQNILMRFGLKNKLDFALPITANYFGYPQPFHKGLLSESMRPESGRYNILTHHLRFNASGINEVMYDDAVWVTIMRDPAGLFESLYDYYDMKHFFNVALLDLIQTPTRYPIVFSKRLNNRIGINQMMYDLGMEIADFTSPENISQFIDNVGDLFDLVMIADFMEPSLVLLADLMRWPLEYVSSLKLNSRGHTASLSAIDKEAIRSINSADSAIYQHFLQVFQKKVAAYGKERMRTDVLKLIHLNENLRQRCVAVPPDNEVIKHVTPGSFYTLSNPSDPLCKYATARELGFTNELRAVQRNRIKILNRLENLLS